MKILFLDLKLCMLQVALDLGHHGFRGVHSSKETLEGDNLPTVILVLGYANYLPGDVPAIHEDRGPGDKSRLIAGEKNGRADHVLRIAHATHRNKPFLPFH